MKKKDEIKLNDKTLEEVYASNLPKIYVHEVIDRLDGSADITFDTNKAFDELYKKEKGRKQTSNRGLGNYVLELITKALDKKDGYDLKTLK